MTEEKEVTKISQVPMRSTDGVNIELDLVLYELDYTPVPNYTSDTGPEYTVTPWRVISVNNSARVFRMRNIKGVELEVCLNRTRETRHQGHRNLFADTKALRVDLGEQLWKCEKKVIERKRQIESTLKAIQSAGEIGSFLYHVGKATVPKPLVKVNAAKNKLKKK